MESTCPHLSAPLSHAPFLSSDSPSTHHATPPNLEAEIHDMEDVTGLNGDPDTASKTIVCPWHKYDFNLLDGSSETGLNVCVYDVKVVNEDGDAHRGDWVWIEAPELDGRKWRNWEMIELRGVSEEFADPPTLPPSSSTNIHQASSISGSSSTKLPTTTSPANHLPTLPPSSTLPSLALLILQTPSPTHKLHLTRLTTTALSAGTLSSIRPTSRDTLAAKALFERDEGKWVPPREGVESVDVWDVRKRGKGGSEKSRVLMLRELGRQVIY